MKHAIGMKPRSNVVAPDYVERQFGTPDETYLPGQMKGPADPATTGETQLPDRASPPERALPDETRLPGQMWRPTDPSALDETQLLDRMLPAGGLLPDETHLPAQMRGPGDRSTLDETQLMHRTGPAGRALLDDTRLPDNTRGAADLSTLDETQLLNRARPAGRALLDETHLPGRMRGPAAPHEIVGPSHEGGSHGSARAPLSRVAPVPHAAPQNRGAVSGALTRRHSTVPEAVEDPSASGLLGGYVSHLVARGLLPERRAVSIALQAREAGDTFFRVLAHQGSMTLLQGIYAELASRFGCELVQDKAVLLDQLEEVAWLPLTLAQEKGLLLLKSSDPATAPYATIDPFDLHNRDWVSRCAGKRAVPVPTLPSVLFDTITRLRTRTVGTEHENILIPIDISWQRQEHIRENIEHCDVALIVDYILQRSYDLGASDVHLEPTEDGLLVRFRLDGILQEDSRLPIALHPAVTARVKILAGMDVAERRRPQDGRITALIRKAPIDLRASSVPTVSGEKLVLRLLDEKSLRPSLDTLGMRAQNLRVMVDKITAPHGLILLSGPTGAGKTTTLYSCLSAIDRSRRNVLTIEDPVEYRLKGVHQIQVNEKIGLSFASGLRNILRQDPDVIMVGECRDAETAHMAVQSALTGHLVFSTIHANDAVGVLARLLDMRIDPFLVATAVSLTLSQRLVRTLCPHCRITIEGQELLSLLRSDGVSDEKMAHVGLQFDPLSLYPHAPGCTHCRHTGYKGRQPIFEMLEVNNEMRSLIMSDRYDNEHMRHLAEAHGLVTMLQSALSLVDEGQTSYSELFRVFGDGR